MSKKTSCALSALGLGALVYVMLGAECAMFSNRELMSKPSLETSPLAVSLPPAALETFTDYVVSFKNPAFALCHYQWVGNNFGDDLGTPLVRALIRKRVGRNVTFDIPVLNFANKTENILFRKNHGKCLIHLGSANT